MKGQGLELTNGSAEGTFDWGNYVPETPDFGKALADLDPKEAALYFDMLMDMKVERESDLLNLASWHGVKLAASAEELTDNDIVELGLLLRASVQADGDDIALWWYGVAQDLGLLIGDVLVARHSSLHWALHQTTAGNSENNQAVIAGHRNVANSRYVWPPIHAMTVTLRRWSRGDTVTLEDLVARQTETA